MPDQRQIFAARDGILSDIDEKALQIVRDLIVNTKFFHVPKHYGPEQGLPDYHRSQLKIATVENRLMLPSDKRPGPFHFEPFDPPKHLDLIRDSNSPHKSKFVGLSERVFKDVQLVVFRADFDFEGYRQEMLDHVRKAIEDGADAICFSELAYPDPGPYLDEYDAHEAFEAEMQALADDHDIVIIAGSYHRLTTQTNECRMFLKRDIDTQGRTSQDDSPRRYTKRVPAQKIGEVTRRPVGINYPRYKTNIGKFAVLICLDSFDPTLFFRFLAWHTPGSETHEGRAQPLDIIFVPSYSSNDKGWPLAKHLSYVSQTIVVYVDAVLAVPYSDVFLCGKSAAVSEKHSVESDGGLYKLTTIKFDDYYKRERRAHIETLESSLIFQKLVRKVSERSDSGTINGVPIDASLPE